ncbi:hypothetical protein AGABI1DRAFT_116251 [Agaricus bisporus var. burnettii JB137-S8]|uniref:Uncharacterized protein n=1 Tax=Agaricus bisporus var. burnettii (strain JB137-S8 / ATCC MYA-4627 / FGSC 10392) TaxID=597362 RepID=K5VMJ5_AGABU|nr:uncharacterized protein AGABI1DRAFT_116251 [Agaricus bisporus var. burnettii JB137-S8]EKM75644.1 hypothetical protein AGABI1DRAFT_116251 [Agaricus bisporus var. burnettii JB137-S8]
MHTRMLHVLIQSLLLLFLWLSPNPVLAVPSSAHSSLAIRHTALHARTPPPSESSEPADPSAGHNLKFKEYPIWIKDKSKQLWESHTAQMAREEAIRNYTSPYLTQFSGKQDGWWVSFDFGRIWRHFLWETMPKLWSSPELPQEDVFLLRAMEQPTYSSVNELPTTLKPKLVQEQGRTCDQ